MDTVLFTAPALLRRGGGGSGCSREEFPQFYAIVVFFIFNVD
jgi:hypothetical protein